MLTEFCFHNKLDSWDQEAGIYHFQFWEKNKACQKNELSGLVCSGAGLDNGGNPSITAVRPPTIQRMDSNLTSTLNSLDYWDYSVELECLSGGPDGNDKEVFFW